MVTAGTPAAPIGLNCPECGALAAFRVGAEQAFCGNDDCRILMWDPTKTLAEMAAEGVHEIDIGEPEDADDQDPTGVSLP